ncbi:TetR family transcriptional regulator [Knoellia sinensis KCTC 19936]|uniref:TetR family transcriptional regulator n=1 Tax=Knoellia sinensis KCTC 19936 TaxID=1385520 RepID=A0A0A0J943_9MICO|nr:TetR/AcrR family transcriptional regulator [Knoellia sinensis]KGN32131.1 TetR family transcriptional regulator [Knoellia sinensis KCTC 19936]
MTRAEECPEEFDPTRLLTPRAREVLEAARTLLERDGWAALTMRALADELGIAAPSLYKHFASKDALKSQLVAVGLKDFGEALRPVTSVAALVRRYREVAGANPELYRLATHGPLDRDALPPGLEDWSGSPFFEATGEPYRAQALWAAVHGMVILELDGRFPTGSAPKATWDELANHFS